MLRLKACFLTVAVFLATLFIFLPWRTSSQTSIVRLTNTPEQAVSLNPSLSDDGLVVVFESSANLLNGAGNGVGSSFHAVRSDVRGEPPLFHDLGATRVVSPALSGDGSGRGLHALLLRQALDRLVDGPRRGTSAARKLTRERLRERGRHAARTGGGRHRPGAARTGRGRC